jgi:FKBP-type peptidyl-prolyl cis-trans isomerase
MKGKLTPEAKAAKAAKAKAKRDAKAAKAKAAKAAKAKAAKAAKAKKPRAAPSAKQRASRANFKAANELADELIYEAGKAGRRRPTRKEAIRAAYGSGSLSGVGRTKKRK